MKRVRAKQEGRGYRTFLLLLIPIVIYLLISLTQHLATVPEKQKEIYRYIDGYVYPYGVDTYSFYKDAVDLSEGKKIEKPNLLSYIDYSVYSTGKFLNPGFSVAAAIFYTPLIFGVLSIILIFLITKKALNETAGFVASVLFSTHYLMLRIFRAGYGDTGPLNILLSLLFIFLLFKIIGAFKNKSKNNAIIFIILGIITVLLFAFAWNGYYYILLITAVFLVIYLLIHLYKRKEYKKAIALIIILAICGIFSIIFLKHQILESRLYMRLAMPKTVDGYPDLSFSIQELKRTSFNDILTYMGQWPFLILALIGLIGFARKTGLFLHEDEKSIFKTYLSVFFIISFVGISFITKANIYFGMITLVFVAAGVYYLCSIISNIIKDKYNKTAINSIKIETILVMIGLALLLIFLVPKTIYYLSPPPYMDDTIYLTAEKIKANSSDNSVVTSWWDEGHFYNAFTDRKVTVKAFPNPQKMYLIEKALSTDNENFSAGIFRILNCGNVSDEMIKKNLSFVIENTKCSPSQHFLVLSSWVKRYADAIYWFGNWNFEKQETDYDTSKPYIDFGSCIVKQDTINCGESGEYVFNKATGEATFNGVPISSIYPSSSGGYAVKDKKTNYVAVLYKVGSSYESAAIKKNVIDSIFVRLYFFNGAGLKHFRKFSEITADKRVVAYEVVW